jgi:hypothetical protein
MALTPRAVEPLARAGFAVKGVVYLLLGVLALLAGLGIGGQVTDPEGALRSLLDRPYGRTLVAGLALGLMLYAGWRFLEAFADANRVGRDRRGVAKRVVWAFSGTAYALLAVDAGRLALRWDPGGPPQIPATIIGSPLAPWLIVVIAAGVILYAIKETRRALSNRLSEQLNLSRLSREAGPLVLRISRIGIMARAAVMAASGIVLLRARANPGRATSAGMSDSLRLIAALPSGPELLTLVAAGLMAYGVYQLVHARYRRIAPP